MPIHFVSGEFSETTAPACHPESETAGKYRIDYDKPSMEDDEKHFGDYLISKTINSKSLPAPYGTDRL